MVRKTVDAPDTEPNSFERPSEGEKLFQVVDLIEDKKEPDIVLSKCEVAIGEESGRSLLHRLTLNEDAPGFFATRMFLKAIGEPYKGKGLVIDTDNWPGRNFWGIVKHNKSKDETKTYANISDYNYDKPVDQHHISETENPGEAEAVAWDEDMK